MTILSYKEAADRIARQRQLRLSALRDDLLVVVASHLRNYKPNTANNIKHPWKDNDRHAIRAWCMLHGRQWERLIVRADDVGHLTFHCSGGCSEESIEQAINLRKVTAIRTLTAAIAKLRSASHISSTSHGRVTPPGNSRSSIHSSADARHLRLVSEMTGSHDRERQPVTFAGSD